MPTFLYRAVNLESQQVVEGAVEAPDDREARALLRARGVMPLSLVGPPTDELAEGLAPILDRLTFKPPSRGVMSIYVRQLAAMLEAGLSIVEALALLAPQTPSESLREATQAVRKDLLAGAGFGDALSHHPRVFPPLMIHLSRAGELAGELDQMLSRLAEMLEQQLELERKIKGALTYPAAVTLVLVGVVTVMLAFVVPTFATLFGKAGASLPWPTLVLIALSGWLRALGPLLLPLAGGVYLAYRAYRTSPAGRPIVDRAWLRVPVVGRLLLERDANTFTRAFGSVYGAGVPIVSALETCRALVANAAVADVLARAEAEVRTGRPFAEQLLDTPYFPSVLAHMMAIGEASGQLEELAAKAVAYSDREVDHQVRQLTTMLEPLLTVVMGVIVMAVALALYLPLFDLPKILSGGHP